MLPRLKYHNPSVSMTVDRSIPQTDSPTLTLFSHPPSPSATPAAQSDARAAVQTIDMKGRSGADIWDALLRLTGAAEVAARDDDRAVLAELESQNAVSDADRARQLEVNARVKREEDLLRQAKIDAALD
ncbi:MAG: hypothetical protein INR71_08525 [Terriglobus roseus]|nr:hypothetical protein [Terriglobus roseus]